MRNITEVSPCHAPPPAPPFLPGGGHTRLRFALASSLGLLMICGTPLWAAPESEDEPRAIADEQAQSAEKSAADPTAASTRDALDESGPVEKVHDASDVVDRLERAIEGMRSAQNRIRSADTSGKTQKIQEQVVKDLEEILTLLKKQQGRQQSQSQNQKRDQNQQQSERQKMQKDQADPQNSGAKKDSDNSADPREGRRNEGKSTDSQERTDPAKAAAERARRAQMIKDVWGHLPPHVREAMLNSVSEKYLPKYEELVKKYYEALAEKNRKSSGK